MADYRYKIARKPINRAFVGRYGKSQKFVFGRIAGIFGILRKVFGILWDAKSGWKA